jgi:hypothetical protein
VPLTAVKYFFLSEGWIVGRVWQFGGLWDEVSWRRKPQIEQMSLSIWERGERLWLYRVEAAVLMVEVKPTSSVPDAQETNTIGQVVLKRLISGDQVLDLLCTSEHPGNQV